MNHAKKMVLISPDVLQRLNNSAAAPKNETLNALENDMNNVLHASDLEDRTKWAYYQQMLQRRQHFHDEMRKPVEIPIVASSAGGLNALREEILRSIPKAFKTKGELLLDRLCGNELISWDRHGTVSINGAPIPNSNIVDLVCDVVKCKKASAGPVGCAQFVEALRQINVPQEFIGNPQRRQPPQQPSTPRPTFPSLSARRRRTITPPVPERRRRLVNRAWARFTPD
jgi:hypothetical protein